MKLDKQNLVERAQEAMKNAIAPYSNFRVGAALLADSGKTYSGCNIENPSLTLSVCAERVAMLKALSQGERKFKALAIVSSSADYCPPCGACRQIFFEFSPEIEIILTDNRGSIITKSLKELLPFPFKKT